MNKLIKKIILSFLFVFLFISGNATHIVGGVIYYEHLGNGRFKLIFEIYRDCSSQVGFDGQTSNNPNFSLPPFYFSVFKGTSATNMYLPPSNRLFLLDTMRIRPVITNPCLDPAKMQGSCVVRGRYETTIQLTDGSVGHTVQYVRCCRNGDIKNIENQIGTGDKPGITLRTYIPPFNSLPNNSARFKEFPPVFICAGQQFYFDHSATDKDGDQLTYHITNPLVGANTNFPIDSIQYPNPPPVTWTSGYGISNVLGGTPPMMIDQTSGLLSCKPDNPGRYVVSVLVKEWRNGVVIDSFARDFQYNVLECDLPNANAPFLPGTYDPFKNIGVFVDCGNFKIDFTNTSTNAQRYEWRFGDPKSGANNVSTDVNPSHTFSDTGVYIVTLFAFKTKTSGELCIDSTRRICKIYPVKTAFTFTSKCQGQYLQFNDATPSQDINVSKWDWSFGDGNTSTLQNPLKAYTNPGTYTVKLSITTNSGCKADSSLPVIVYPNPTIPKSPIQACIFTPINLNCKVTIPPPYSITAYKWTLPNGTTFNLCNPNYTPTTNYSGQAKLWAISDKGCEDSSTFSFTVNPLPTIKAFRDTTLCYDKNTTISATGSSIYSWSPDIYLQNANSGMTVASPPYPNSIVYKVKGTDVFGCVNYDSIKIDFFNKTFIDAGGDTSVCLNSSSSAYRNIVKLDGKGSFSQVYWTPATYLDNPNISTPTSTPPVNMQYVFYGLDVNKCWMKDTIELTVLDPNLDILKMKDTTICQGDTISIRPLDQGVITSYTWSPNFWISNPNIRLPRFWPRDTLSYILKVENYCYSKFDTILINSSELPDLMLKDLDSICVGSTYQFVSNPNLVSYIWTTNEPSFSSKVISNPIAIPLQTQKYILQVKDIYGCINTDSIKLDVNYPPNVAFMGLPRYICQGDSALIKISTSKNSTFLWSPSQFVSSPTADTAFVFPYDTTQFSVLVTSQQKCTTLSKFTVNVQKKIQPKAIRPLQICKGKFINMKASGGLYYLWKPSYNINDTLIDTPQVFPEYTFTYQVRISNDCFADSIKVDVYVDSIPYVYLGKDTSIYRGQEIQLHAVNNAETIEWFPKEKISSNPLSNNIEVAPKDTTLYWVEATNSRGCIGRDSVWVYVYGKNVILIPTGFSPNKDGINDIFRVAKHLNIRKLNLFEVHNRWGEKVFSTNNIDKGWNGMHGDLPSPVGTYIWHIEAVNYEGEKIKQSGTVTLIR